MNQRGYILLPVVVAITLLAAIAFLVNRESGMEVNLVAGELDAARAQYVAEAGLQHAGWVAQNSACSGYALPDTAFGEHSYSATFTPTGGSPVSIAATGMLASGATRTLYRQTVPVYENPNSVTVQLDGTNGGDVPLDSFFNTRNHGANYAYVSTNPSQIAHHLIKFDLSGIKTGVKVLSAKLEAYQFSASNVSADAAVSVHRVTRNWVEGTRQGGGTADGATWDTWDGVNAWATPGGDFDPEPVATSPVIDTNDVWIAWPVEELVQGWVSGTYPNQGLLLKGSGSLWLNLAPDEENLAAIHPKLTITYACECGNGGTSNTVTLEIGPNGKDTHVLSGSQAAKNYGSGVNLWTNNSGNLYHSLMQFNLATLPAGVTVTSAILDLYVNDIDTLLDGVASIFQVTGAWEEGTGAGNGTIPADGANWDTYDGTNFWATPGGDHDPTVIDSVLFPGSSFTTPGRYLWNITELANGWLQGSYPNHGLMIKGTGGTLNKFTVSSGEINDPTQRPKLTISYTCPCSGCPEPALLFYRDEFNSSICDSAIDYSGSDGNLDWSPWLWNEVGESVNDPCLGGVKLLDDLGDTRLRFSSPDKGALREADLTPFSVASLRFDYRRVAWDSATDALVVEASTNGGTDWSQVAKFTGPADDAAYQSAEADISAWIGPDTLIRFMLLNTTDGIETVYIDNIQIDSEPVTGGPAGPEYPVTADAMVYEGSAGSNYGSDPELDVGKGNPSGGKHYASALRFDLAALPPTATVTSATLRLYQGSASGSGSIDIGLYKADASWDEGTVTWSSLSDDTIQHASTSVPLGTTGWYQWTLPPGLVHEWRDIANHGLVLRYEGTQKGKVGNFASKEDASSALHPELLLEYTE